MELSKLRIIVLNNPFQSSLDELLKLKVISEEKALIKPVVIINEWLKETLSVCKATLAEMQPVYHSSDELAVLFTNIFCHDLSAIEL